MASQRKMPDGEWNHRFADVNGVNIHYVRQGSGLPLILVHGWPEFWWTWHRNIDTLAEKFDVVTPDLRGFGQSEKPATDNVVVTYSAEQHARDILALADHLGFERFGVVGHDVGGAALQALARLHPERMVGMFLFNVAYPGIGKRWAEADHLNQIWYQSLHQQPWAADLIGHSHETCRIYLANMLSHISYDPTAFDPVIDVWVDNFMRPGNIQGGFNWYIACHQQRLDLVRHGAPDLPKISVPSRFLWGAHDPVLLSQWTDNLPAYFEDPQIEIANNAGHFVHFEASTRANSAITEFFSARAG